MWVGDNNFQGPHLITFITNPGLQLTITVLLTELFKATHRVKTTIREGITKSAGVYP